MLFPFFSFKIIPYLYVHLGMHFSDEEFANVNPNKKVPAIQDGDLKLFEW